jgi:hypothetical protein
VGEAYLPPAAVAALAVIHFKEEPMPYCANCGKLESDTASYCSACGKRLNQPEGLGDAQAERTMPSKAEPITVAQRSSVAPRRPAGVTVLSILAAIGFVSSGVSALLLLVLILYVGVFGVMLRDVPYVSAAFFFFPRLEAVERSAQNYVTADIWGFEREMLFFTAAYGLVGYGLWKQRRWGRWLAVALVAFLMLWALRAFVSDNSGIGSMIGSIVILPFELWILVYLLRVKHVAA